MDRESRIMLSDCNDWLAKKDGYSHWTLMPRSSNNYDAFYLYPNNIVGNKSNILAAVRPSVYLNPNVEIMSGSGMSSSPIILKVS